MKKVLFIFTLFITSVSFAQLQNANWCFRINAKVNFNLTPPNPSTSAVGTSMPFSNSGASVSNNFGQLLFYTDGIRVWDKNNNIMPNGGNIGGGTEFLWNQQNTVIVPKPNHPNIYYIFVVNKIVSNIGQNINGLAGLHYSIVDMCANNGNGDVIIINNKNNFAVKDHAGLLIDYDYNTNTGLQIFENRISSTLNHDKTKVWVSFFTRFDVGGQPDRYAYQYLVTENGINGQPDGSNPDPTTFLHLDNANFPTGPSNWYVNGSMKFSPDGTRLCDANKSSVTLYNFNKQFGTLTWDQNIYTNSFPSNPGYGVEFSPNSSLLYFSTYDQVIYQDGFSKSNATAIKKFIRIRQKNFDANPNDSAVIIGQFEITPPGDAGSRDNIITPIPVLAPYGEMQLAINNKIYVCAFSTSLGNGKLDAITLPDVPGTGCSYVIQDLTLAPGTVHDGYLPQWVHKTIYTPIPTCPGPWPKVYSGVKPVVYKLVQGNSGNCFMYFKLKDAVTAINHLGQNFPANNDFYTTNYNTTTGMTNWIYAKESPDFSLSNNSIYLTNSVNGNGIFRDENTGLPVTGPVPLDSRILAEDNGVFITVNSSSGNVFNIISGGVIIASFPMYPGTSYIEKAVFDPYDPGGKKLYVSYQTGFNPSDFLLAVYSFNLNTLTLLNNPSLNSLKGPLLQVNKNRKALMLNSNQELQQYDYQTNSYSPVSILGFFNNSLVPISSDNQIIEDKILVFNSSNKKLYSLNTDVANPSQKKIQIIFGSGDPIVCPVNKYFYSGDDVFIAGAFTGSVLQIGNQVMPQLSSSCFITKFNLLSDFSFTSNTTEQEMKPNGVNSISIKNEIRAPAIELTVVPNPVKNYLQLKIGNSNKKSISPYLISITNSLGLPVFNKKTNDNYVTVNVADLIQGIYYVTVSTDKATKVTKMFTKQ